MFKIELMSICIVILVGFILGNPALGNAPSWGNSDDEKGYFQTFFWITSTVTGLFSFLRNIIVSISRSVNLSALSDFFNILELISNLYLCILMFDWAE